MPCTSCGGTDHKRPNHHRCPNNKKRKRKADGTSSAETHTADKWQLLPTPPGNKQFQLMWYSVFKDKALLGRFGSHLKVISNNAYFHHLAEDSSLFSIFQTLQGESIEKLVRFINSSMKTYNRSLTQGAKPIDEVTVKELRMWLAQFLTYCVLPCGFEYCDEVLRMLITKKLHRSIGPITIPLLDIVRFRLIKKHLHAYDVSVENGGTTSFKNTTDKTQCVLRSGWLRKCLETSCEIFFTKHANLTLDDWHRGLRDLLIPVKKKSDRKAEPWGYTIDLLCCALTRAIIDLRLQERGYNAEAAQTDIFQNLKNRWNNIREQLSGVTVTADRGYVKEHLWRALDAIDAGFVFVAHDSFKTVGSPFIGASKTNASKYDDEFHIPDEINLGDDIIAAKLTYEMDPSTHTSPDHVIKPVYAVAVRTQKTIENKSEVLRFFLRSTGWNEGEENEGEEALFKTFVMQPKAKKLLSAHPLKTLFFSPPRLT
jgi:hypothetical protein